jgi:competence CoiA-like predicted nuclease
MLVARLKGQRITASQSCEYGLDYQCPDGHEMILKRGDFVVPHFAHKSITECRWSVGETVHHMIAKDHFRQAMNALGIPAELEWVVGDQRADVMIFANGAPHTALELQHCKISPYYLQQRREGYQSKGLKQAWIRIIDWKNASHYAWVFEGDQQYWDIERYSHHRWESYIEDLWFYDTHLVQIYTGIFSDCILPVRVQNEDGKWEETGDTYVSRRWKTLKLFPRAFDEFVEAYGLSPVAKELRCPLPTSLI